MPLTGESLCKIFQIYLTIFVTYFTHKTLKFIQTLSHHLFTLLRLFKEFTKGEFYYSSNERIIALNKIPSFLFRTDSRAVYNRIASYSEI